MVRILVGWLAAVVAATLAGSLIQSQFTLAAIARIHAPVAWQDRLSVFGHDLVHFGPLWGMILALGLLLAFLVAGWLSGRRPAWRSILFPLAGLVAVVTALSVMQAMLPVTVIAAARSGWGTLLLSLGGALGGAVYLAIVPYRQNGQN
ncbi:MAG: hypothetical protein V2J42_14230 [Wenzhouxiangella sp.]|jgi:hypothetical protein|nr:hypothetical protein [Wenzhouxiangella sp.]